MSTARMIRPMPSQSARTVTSADWVSPMATPGGAEQAQLDHDLAAPHPGLDGHLHARVGSRPRPAPGLRGDDQTRVIGLGIQHDVDGVRQIVAHPDRERGLGAEQLDRAGRLDADGPEGRRRLLTVGREGGRPPLRLGRPPDAEQLQDGDALRTREKRRLVQDAGEVGQEVLVGGEGGCRVDPGRLGEALRHGDGRRGRVGERRQRHDLRTGDVARRSRSRHRGRPASGPARGRASRGSVHRRRPASRRSAARSRGSARRRASPTRRSSMPRRGRRRSRRRRPAPPAPSAVVPRAATVAPAAPSTVPEEGRSVSDGKASEPSCPSVSTMLGPADPAGGQNTPARPPPIPRRVSRSGSTGSVGASPSASSRASGPASVPPWARGARTTPD